MGLSGHQNIRYGITGEARSHVITYTAAGMLLECTRPGTVNALVSIYMAARGKPACSRIHRVSIDMQLSDFVRLKHL